MQNINRVNSKNLIETPPSLPKLSDAEYLISTQAILSVKSEHVSHISSAFPSKNPAQIAWNTLTRVRDPPERYGVNGDGRHHD